MAFVAVMEKSDLWTKARAVMTMRGIQKIDAGYSYTYIRDVLLGNRTNKIAQERIAKALGFSTWEEFVHAEAGIVL